MRRLMGPFLRQMKPVQTIRQSRIVRGQENQSVGFGTQCLGQRAALFCVTRAQNHHAAFGQVARRRDGIAKPLIVSHENKQARVEAFGLPC